MLSIIERTSEVFAGIDASASFNSALPLLASGVRVRLVDNSDDF
jgi:hypothetical protein